MIKQTQQAEPSLSILTFIYTVLLFYVLLFVITGEGWKIATWLFHFAEITLNNHTNNIKNHLHAVPGGLG